MSGIKINKIIYKLLSEDAELKTIVGGNIFPLIANEDTKFPFIVFSRTSLTTDYCKDGSYQDNVEVEVICVSSDYTESINIAECVRRILENTKYKGDEMRITQCRLGSIQEYTNEFSFIQELTFKITVE